MPINLNGTTGVQVPLGSAAAPSVTNTSNTNIGLYFPTSTTLGLSTAGTNALYIDASQNVGIGTTSPGNRLHVYGSNNGNSGVSIQNTGGSGRRYTIYSSTAGGLYFANDTGGGDQMILDASGNLLVGTTLTNLYAQTSGYGFCFRKNASLDILAQSDNCIILNRTTTNGSIEEFRYAGTIVGSISVTGSATAYNTSSDYRLKENVTPMTTGLATISALKPVTYDWISDNSKGEGFIAHELQDVIPLAVSGEKDAVNEDGSIKPQGVDYSKIVVHLVSAIQELKAEIDALKGTK